jgi:outer membrane protein W
MKKENFLRLQKIIFLNLFLMVFFSCYIFAENKNQITIFGGLNHVMEYGSEDDYVFGENDFPVTPAHTPPAFGLSYTHFFFKKIGFEVDFRYFLSSKLTLEDPSDGDKVKIDSSKYYAITGNFIYRILSGKFRPYLLLGAGFDTLVDVEDQELTTEYGFPLILYAPEKKTDFVANAGVGVKYFISSSFGTRFDIRYIFMPKTDDHPAINSFNFVFGIFYGF